jgi:hypothetical protein
MTIDLKQLPQLQPLFKLLSSGAHLNRLQDSELWVELENHQSQYETLFTALGFSLVLDGRGYAYFKTDQASTYTGKLTRRLALLLMLLFEYQADQGLHLFQFQQWQLDTTLINKLHIQYHAILEAEEITSPQTIKEIWDSAARIGYCLPCTAIWTCFRNSPKLSAMTPCRPKTTRIHFEFGTVWFPEARVAQ